MPLSENEQRILRQIEQQLERDPTFSTRGYKVPRGRVVLYTLAVLAGLAVTVLSLAVSVWVAVACFVGTVALAVLLEREARLLAREQVGTLPVSVWLGAARNMRPNRRHRRDEPFGDDEPTDPADR